ncbi:MAG: cysteine desulfurase [Candidatus Zambryskibacteria bacterium]|nr:cysteine desulfurase [Candidatus Zambryskibacteria bacterium]
MSKKYYFFDYAATTPIDSQVFSAMKPYFKKHFGNPGGLHSVSRKARQAVNKATKNISKILNCSPSEFIYTASATEADNLAIIGVARSFGKGKIIISSIEHKAVLKACEALEKEGFKIVKLPVHKNGLVDLNALKKELDKNTILVSITSADSETGTIQPIKQIAKIIKNYQNRRAPSVSEGALLLPYFHTDASQTAKYLDLNVKKLGVDLMTLSSHKTYGPKGIGGLYIKREIRISPIIYGGGQEKGFRSGTENVPAIVGFAKALELAFKNRKKEYVYLKKLRDKLEKNIKKNIKKISVNGHPTLCLPNFLNISILGIEGEAMLLHLDKLGIMASTGSACNSESLEPSYILTALGKSYKYIHGSLRFTLGKYNNESDINYVLEHLPKVVEKLRNMSPIDLNSKYQISNKFQNSND